MKIRVAAAQIKPRKGDYEYNLNRVGEIFAQFEQDAPDTDVLVLPETSLSGYFLEGGVCEDRPALANRFSPICLALTNRE